MFFMLFRGHVFMWCYMKKKLVGIKERCTRTVKNMNELSLLNKKEGVKLVCFCLELDLIFFHKFNLL